ncbi:MAG TPA: c-type cytochrome [Candidatus Binataceae bacterium]|nr:c-type cytochrome [Candidatus Binataceae bacterium]
MTGTYLSHRSSQPEMARRRSAAARYALGRTLAVVVALSLAHAAAAANPTGDPARGVRVFQAACAACHSLDPGVQLTGPSLAGVWGRKAGSLTAFPRFSEALKRSGIVWTDESLDAWLRDPKSLVPGTYMSFAGLANPRARSNLIAFLRAFSEGRVAPEMAPPRLPDLKTAAASARVTAIRYCHDTHTYFVTNADGRTIPYWEYNLRFKTDSSARGPRPNEPVLVSQGMQGDRAQIVFSSPREISRLVHEGC